MSETADLQQLVSRQQQEIAALRSQAEQGALDTCVSAGLDASGVEFSSPAARAQAASLLRSEIRIVNHDGQTHATGPGLVPAATHIKARLESEEYRHFRRGGSPTSPSPPSATPFGQRPADPPISLGAQILAHAQAAAATRQATHGDARMDMSRPIGLSLPR